MRGILRKILREAWIGTLLFGGAFLLVEILLNLMLPQILSQTRAFVGIPFIRNVIGALLGVDFEGEVTAQVMQAIVWVHPVVLAIVWAHGIMFCTRYPAAEIDRGTIDWLLALPVSRRAIYLCETIGSLISGWTILAFGAIGYMIGSQAMSPELRPRLAVVMLILFNLFCVYIAVCGLAFLISSMSDRRGRAVFTVFGVVLASFLLSFLAQFWDPASGIAFLSVLDYYQPATILRTGAVSIGDVGTLLTVGIVSWAAGCEITARRNICTT
jgi:ABC-type transport system involved in multi-copper enzyme maturation permease subunit